MKSLRHTAAGQTSSRLSVADYRCTVILHKFPSCEGHCRQGLNHVTISSIHQQYFTLPLLQHTNTCWLLDGREKKRRNIGCGPAVVSNYVHMATDSVDNEHLL